MYGTLGTVYNTRRRLATFIDAIGLGGWSGLVTVGTNMNPDDFVAAPSMTVERFVPQADVLDHADVMLCHGGLGSVLGAIETATPMVMVPLGADQLVNAEIAQQLGIATIVDPAAAGRRNSARRSRAFWLRHHIARPARHSATRPCQ